MAELLMRALARAGRSINNPFAMNHGYIQPRRGDAQRDFAKVVGDMRKVGKDLKTVTNKELQSHG